MMIHNIPERVILRITIKYYNLKKRNNMKSFILKSFVFLLGISLLTAFGISEPINIGDQAPMTDQVMADTEDNQWTLEKAAKENGLLVMFSCNTCPFVIAWEGRYNDLAAYAEENNIGMIVVNSNSARRDGDDSMGAMVKKAAEQEYQFPYVLDRGNALADAFGAAKTPDVFLFNGEMELAYKGAIDNSGGGRQEVSEEYLMDAMSNMVQGKPAEPNSTKSIGCSIKRS